MTSGSAYFVVFGFESTHDALHAEEALLAAGFEVALIPTPRALGSLCGFAVRVSADSADGALEVLNAAGVTPQGRIDISDRIPLPDQAGES